MTDRFIGIGCNINLEKSNEVKGIAFYQNNQQEREETICETEPMSLDDVTMGEVFTRTEQLLAQTLPGVKHTPVVGYYIEGEGETCSQPDS